MVKKTKILFLFIFTLYFCTQLQAKSSVWIAEKKGHRVVIAGSVHLLKPSQLPLPSEYILAFDNAQRIIFETDLDEANSVSFQRKIIQHFTLPINTTLQDTLKPDVWAKLQSYMKKNNIPMQLTSLNAAFIAITLPIYIYQTQGYSDGIDEILRLKAKENNKKIGKLESVDEQLNVLISLNDIDPNLLIENTIMELTTPEYSLDNVVNDVFKGDVEKLNTVITSMKKDTFPIYKALILKRNKAWISKIENYAYDKMPTFIIVGALHLAGEDSVLNLLKQKGYQISYY